MPTRDCERFLELLVEAPDPGDPSADDRLFMERHARSCPSCAALWEASVSIPRDLPPISDELVASVLNSRFQTRARARSWPKVVGLVACVAAVALFILLGPFGPSHDAPDAEPSSSLVDGSERVFSEGERVVAEAGDRLLTSEGNLELALERGSEISLPVLTEPRVELVLERGFLAAHLLPGSGRAVQVTTRYGKVRVTGTVFSVEKDKRDMRVGVVEGKVQVRSVEDESKVAEVAAGQVFSISDFTFDELTDSSRRRVRSLLGMTSEQPEQNPSEEGTTSKPGAATEVVEALVADAVEEPEQVPASRRGRRDASVESESAAPARQPDKRSPSDYILEARELRKLADWRGAAERYRILLKRYPDSHEAATVLLPLAELELNHLGRAKASLVHFEEYLRRNPTGAMAEEALWGKCGALRTLGKRELEKRNLEIFVEKFPQSMHIGRARTRLVAIDGASVEKK